MSAAIPSHHRSPTHTERVLRKRLMLCALLVSFAATLPACSESKPDVDVSIRTNSHWGTLVYNIQATTEDVVISDVSVNRGNCTIPPGTAAELKRQVNLKFGQEWRGYSHNCKVDNVKEVTVTTSRGTFTFNF